MNLLNIILKIFRINNKSVDYSPYSFSKIDTWIKCPYKFRLKYIDKKYIAYEPNLALLKGSFLHACIEHNNMGENYQTNKIFTEDEKNKALDLLKNFKESELYKLYLSEKGEHEVSFGVSKSNNRFKSTNFDNVNNLIKGKIDYVFKKNNKLYIVDWKSGNYTEKNNQNFDQLMLYAIWGFLEYKNINTINCSFVYVEHLKENSIVFTRENFNEYIEKYNKLMQSIEEDDRFSKIESKQCEYCEYRKFNYCIKEK